MLDAVKVSEYAQALYRAHGDKAEAEAAQRFRDSEIKGDRVAAENWRRIRAAITQIRGPRAK
jgi:hypothetical protein